jgi:hypothetical protein
VVTKSSRSLVFTFAGDQMIGLVKNDTGPQLRFQITERTDNVPVDLTGATVTLHFRAKGKKTVLFSRAASIDNPPSAGSAIFVFHTGDLNLEPGIYEGEVEVVLGSGLRETIYEVVDFELRDEFA